MINKEEFKIVPMNERSIPEILDLAEAARLAQWSYEDYRAELMLENSLTIQIEDNQNNNIAGFMVMRLITSTNTNEYSQADILNIAVSHKYRKRGVGSQLILKGIKEAAKQGPSLIWLEVRRSNAAAISFYEKHGFRVEYDRKNFYTEPIEDALVMKREV